MSFVYKGVDFCFGKKILVVMLFVCIWVWRVSEDSEFYFGLS